MPQGATPGGAWGGTEVGLYATCSRTLAVTHFKPSGTWPCNGSPLSGAPPTRSPPSRDIVSVRRACRLPAESEIRRPRPGPPPRPRAGGAGTAVRSQLILKSHMGWETLACFLYENFMIGINLAARGRLVEGLREHTSLLFSLPPELPLFPSSTAPFEFKNKRYSRYI